MSRKLSDEIIVARMVEWRNLKQLHARDRKQIANLKTELATVKAENKKLRELVAHQQAIIETLKIQMAELQTMVFGKKKKPPTGTVVPVFPLPVSIPRTPDSYHRPLPPTSAITAEVALPLPSNCTCGGSFFKITTHDRYLEDIPLPELTPGYQPNLVTKYVIERGICLACGKAASARDLGGAQVSLGPNVRLLVCHLVSFGGMSYAQVTSLLIALYGLTVSSGEIAAILHTKHKEWLPAYNQLQADIRAAPIDHVDETPWPIKTLQGLGYAWVLADAGSPKVCFALEQSRGAIQAQKLFGQDTDQPFDGVRISDDYAAYRSDHLPGTQQLCWAHLYRTIRDLRHNSNLPEEQLPYVETWYAGFAGIYEDLRKYLKEPYNEVVRTNQATELWQRVQDLAKQPYSSIGEPDKLTRLKAQLLRAGQDRLFVCLPKNTPCDNNRAERDLRQLVLKRKRSFGSKSEKGAQALATILSLCATTWRTTPKGYFKALGGLGV